jgi:hypothetical protein
MVKCGVLFEVRTEFLNIIQINFGFKGLSESSLDHYLTLQLSQLKPSDQFPFRITSNYEHVYFGHVITAGWSRQLASARPAQNTAHIPAWPFSSVQQILILNLCSVV